MLLGPAAGGRLELRAGNTPSLANLQVVARARLRGGEVTVQIVSPVKARYLLIWFTQLPPDSSGTYQASVSNVSLSGTG
jgi:putative peptidoglycan lipid II flippase